MSLQFTRLDWLSIVVFILASAGILYVSRASLRARGSHGFYRFFAWEAILALFLLNWDVWFVGLFSLHQLISWPLLLVSIFLVLHSVYLLRVVGKPDESAGSDVPQLGIEKTTTLVTVGAYKYIRHPLYSSLLFLCWGVFFKDPSWLGGLLASLATGFLVATAKVEEAEDIRHFGAAYKEYMKHTRMFIPFLF
jgi:protein-S-isoprenylcysteine O-methyltransferase Ste14